MLLSQEKVNPEEDASFHSAVQHLSTPVYSSDMQQFKLTAAVSQAPIEHVLWSFLCGCKLTYLGLGGNDDASCKGTTVTCK